MTCDGCGAEFLIHADDTLQIAHRRENVKEPGTNFYGTVFCSTCLGKAAVIKITLHRDPDGFFRHGQLTVEHK